MNHLPAPSPASFWDELMAMKAQHADLTRAVAHYEEVVVQLADRLGVAPPMWQRPGGEGRGGSIGRRGRPGAEAGGEGRPRSRGRG